MISRLKLSALAAAGALMILPAATAIAGSARPTVVEAAMRSQDHQTLVAALKAASLVDTLKGPGPFTVFAPTDAAFAKLPAGTVDSLLQPANREQLRAVLTYHVVPGKVTSKELVRMIRASGGEATLTTAQGGALKARLSSDGVSISDANGGTAMVTKADLASSNGVIHVTDAVSLPK
jgi:uncharacterized surface protein with fasciclin (FAS1) repeats